MVLIEGGQVGFDEGGVLQALKEPMWRQISKTYDYNRKGLVIEELTTETNVSMANVLTVLVLGGVVTLTPFFLDAIKDFLPDIPFPKIPEGVDPTCYAKTVAVFGPITGPIIAALRCKK